VKTAVSLPDDLYRLAEAAARKLKMSRSELYAAALSEFLARRQASMITERLNEIYTEEPTKLDSALHSAQLKNLAKDGW
jgi:metal-responsive CopG/Arc/MetJ family transcriptional regulator